MTLSLTCPTHKAHRRLWNIRSGKKEIYYCSHSEHDKDNSRSLWTAEQLLTAHEEAKKKEAEDDSNA